MDKRSDGCIWRWGFGTVREENVWVVGVKWSLERRIGWEIWSLWRAFWRMDKSGGFERRRARTVMPVPPGTAFHQLCSVPPTGRRVGEDGCAAAFWCCCSSSSSSSDIEWASV